MESFSILCLALCFCLFLSADLPASAAKATDFTLNDLEGNEVSLSSFQGKVILLDFWATWCPPCRQEIPGFINLYKKYKDKGVEIIGVSLDKSPDKVKTFVEKGKVNYPILMGNKEVTELYGGVRSIPTTIIIDRDMNIVGQHVGFAEESVFQADIEKLLMPGTGDQSPAEPTEKPEETEE